MKFTKRLRLWALFNRYYAKDGEPIRCFECGSKDLAEKVTDHLDWLPCEKFTYCCDCREGVMVADFGDYVIKGVKGEVYPCKPDIFDMTYEVAQDD